jgi:hypothetical protein
MKPTIQFNEKSGERESRRGFMLPKTDYNLQAGSMANAGSRCFGSCRQSFRAISRDYFENEARRSFAGEALLFGVMVMTAAMPILNSAREMAQLVRSFGPL